MGSAGIGESMNEDGLFGPNDGDISDWGLVMVVDDGDAELSASTWLSAAAAAAWASCSLRRYRLGGPLFLGWYS